MRIMETGKKVFIAGSRRLSRLSADVKRRIDNIVDRRLTVIVGDANGADKAVQKYLDSRRYDCVIVFCMEDGCRNNVGKWRTRKVEAADPSRRDFTYYSTKDREMVGEADYGLMLWDGRSRGTLRSIVDLVQRAKPAVVYVAPNKSFWTLRHADDLSDMLRQVDPASLQRVNADLKLSTVRPGTAEGSESLPLF